MEALTTSLLAVKNQKVVDILTSLPCRVQRRETNQHMCPLKGHEDKKSIFQKPRYDTLVILSLASFNARSIYGREEAILNIMRERRIVIMMIQETNLALNNPPRGLPKSTIYKENETAGERGLITIIHPSWEHLVSIPEIEDDRCTHVQWITIEINDGWLYVGNVYLPNHSTETDKQLAHTIVQKLVRDCQQIPMHAPVLLMGDWNADIEKNHGDNQTLVKTLIAQTHLSLVQTCASGFTRPQSGYHIDNMLANENAKRLITKRMECIRAPLLRNGIVGSESDHLPIAASQRDASHLKKENQISASMLASSGTRLAVSASHTRPS